MRRLASLLASLLLLTLAAGPAFAQYPPDDEGETVVLSDTVVAPGEAITACGEGFTPGATATVSFDGAVLGSTIVAADGAFCVTVTIPTGAECGDNTLDIASDAGDAAAVAIVIECPAAAGVGGGGVATDDSLAATGGNVTVGMALILALFAAGGVALYATRKKDTVQG